MPTTYTHFKFGETMLKQYPKETRELILKNKTLFQIGLHGPDILFYYKPLKSNSVKKTGSALHKLPARDFFAPGAKVLSDFPKSEQEQMLPYLLGFICHFSLDCMCHGYIESKIHKSRISHSEIEAELDRFLMIQDSLNPFTFVQTDHVVPSQENAERIARFFPEISSAQMQKSLSSMVYYLRLLLVPHEWKRHLAYGILRLIGHYDDMHGLIINREANPLCADSNLRLTKLTKKAETLCLELTANYLACLNKQADLDPRFQRTFGPGPDWQSIPVLSQEEELTYEV